MWVRDYSGANSVRRELAASLQHLSPCSPVGALLSDHGPPIKRRERSSALTRSERQKLREIRSKIGEASDCSEAAALMALGFACLRRLTQRDAEAQSMHAAAKAARAAIDEETIGIAEEFEAKGLKRSAALRKAIDQQETAGKLNSLLIWSLPPSRSDARCAWSDQGRRVGRTRADG